LRLIGKALFDNSERKRLYKEAREYMALRRKRRKYVKDQGEQKERPAVLSTGD
jgi:hypothetical protein